MTHITINKVVSRNFIMDYVARFQNIVGLNLTSYERMLDNGMKQIDEEIKQRRLKLRSRHYAITQMTNGAIAIVMSGETE